MLDLFVTIKGEIQIKKLLCSVIAIWWIYQVHRRFLCMYGSMELPQGSASVVTRQSSGCGGSRLAQSSEPYFLRQHFAATLLMGDPLGHGEGISVKCLHHPSLLSVPLYSELSSDVLALCAVAWPAHPLFRRTSFQFLLNLQPRSFGHCSNLTHASPYRLSIPPSIFPSLLCLNTLVWVCGQPWWSPTLTENTLDLMARMRTKLSLRSYRDQMACNNNPSTHYSCGVAHSTPRGT